MNNIIFYYILTFIYNYPYGMETFEQRLNPISKEKTFNLWRLSAKFRRLTAGFL